MAVIVIRAEVIVITARTRGYLDGDRLMGVSSTFRCQRYPRCVELLLAGVQTVSQRSLAAWREGERGGSEWR